MNLRGLLIILAASVLGWGAVVGFLALAARNPSLALLFGGAVVILVTCCTLSPRRSA